MAAYRFGQFLVNKGIVDEDAVLEALDIQMKKTLPIGKIALSERMLTKDQVLKILNHQATAPGLFGMIALELGYLTEYDIDNLLAIQAKHCPRIGEILVGMNKMSREKCNVLLKEYHGEVAA